MGAWPCARPDDAAAALRPAQIILRAASLTSRRLRRHDLADALVNRPVHQASFWRCRRSDTTPGLVRTALSMPWRISQRQNPGAKLIALKSRWRVAAAAGRLWRNWLGSTR